MQVLDEGPVLILARIVAMVKFYDRDSQSDNPLLAAEDTYEKLYAGTRVPNLKRHLVDIMQNVRM